MIETIIGLAAAVLTTLAAVPQVHKCWKTKNAGDLSLKMIVAQSGGIALWAVYGVMRGDPIIIVANGVGLLLFAALLYFRVTYRNAAATG